MRYIVVSLLAILLAECVLAQSDVAPVVRIPSKRDSVQELTVVEPRPLTRVETNARVPISQSVIEGPAPNSPSLPPIGTVQAWLKSMTNTPSLSSYWVECNGQVIDDPASPYNGRLAPNLNGTEEGTKRFLRGAPESGAVGGSESHTHPAYRSQKYGSQRLPVLAPGRTEHVPPFYEVVWIMRIK